MFALYQAATGALISLGTVVADPLPDGLAAVDLGTDDRILTGYGYWDPTTRTVLDVVPSPAEAARLAAEQQAVDRAILDATAALMADAHTDGEAWTQPVGAHNAYPLGATVTHQGKTWTSLTPANVWAPGVSGWREVVAEGYPAWVQPTGDHDDYGVGDRVTFEGADYESLIADNVWSPTDYPAGWRKL